MPGAPQPSQRRGKYTPGKYARKACKDPVIEVASEEEEEEEVEVPLQRRRRLVKGKLLHRLRGGKEGNDAFLFNYVGNFVVNYV